MLGILVALAMVAGVSLLVRMPDAGTRSESGDLEEDVAAMEEPTEAFANALHDCSQAILLGDSTGTEACFAGTVTGTPFPVAVMPPQQEPFGLLLHGWDLETTPIPIPRDTFVASLERLLDHFSDLEDMRLKVKTSEATDDDRRVTARMAFWIVGRDRGGHREWLRGWAEISGTQGPHETWPLDRFTITEMESMVAPRDIFTDVAREAGLAAEDPPVLEHPTVGLAAYGAAAADVNGDGLMDLFSTGDDGNSLYLNNGDGTFRDVAVEVFVHVLPRPAAAGLFLDYDNDGDLDLFMSSFGPQYLFENRLVPDGVLTFRDVTQRAGVDRPAVGFSAVAGDINGDGLPDIYVASYNDYGRILPDRWDAGRNGTPNLLFVNQGDGTFKELAAEWGVADERWSYAAAFADIDQDGDQDLYVANDFGGGNALFMNEDGRFVDRAGDRGVYDGGYAMGVSFGDYDRDGDLDLHVTKMSSTAGRRILARLGTGELPSRDRLQELAGGNALYQNLGDGVFRDVSGEAGPFSVGWAWGGGFIDINNDGFVDLHTPNGFLSGASMKDT